MKALLKKAVRIGLLLGLATPGFAAEPASRQEREVDRNLASGQAAYEDGLYGVALKYFGNARRRAADPARERAATLGVVRSLDRQQSFEAMLKLLDDSFIADAPPSDAGLYRFWRARAQFGQGAYKEAIEELNAIDPDALSEENAAARLRMLGRAYGRLGRIDSALAVFELFHVRFPDGAEAPENLLDWARALIERGEGLAAQRVLEDLLARFPEHSLTQRARLWLATSLLDAGELDRASEPLDALLAREETPSDLAAEAWYGKARLAEYSEDFDSAVLALIGGEEAARTQEVRYRGVLARARVLLKMDRVDDALALLRECIQALPGHPLSAEAQLELADAFLTREQYTESLKAYQHYLDAFEDVEGRANAWLGRGWSLLGLRRHREAATSFEKAYALHPGLAERTQALFKVADSFFKVGQFSRAREEYLQMIQVFPGSTLVPMALFQAAECLARQRRVPEAVSEFRAIEDAYPESLYAEQAAMRVGLLQEELSQWERAIAAYNRVMAGYPKGAASADALHRRALIRYRLGLFAEALSDFERVVAEYGDLPAAEQAYYMRGWCLYLLGENQRALEVCDQFIRHYPDSIYVPDVLFWLAEFHYNQGQFAEAERRFLSLAERYPAVELADDALYWAGRAASQQKEYLRANDHYARLARDYPESTRMPDARFAQGDSLSQLGEFSSAILAFEEIIRKYPTHPLLYAAWGRKGDCLYTLGTDQPARYEEAILAYQTVLTSPDATPAMQWQAEFKLGRTQEKLGRTEDALEHYMNVVYEYVAESTTRPPDGAMWFTRAAFAAAAIKETAGDSESAVNILLRVRDAQVSAAPDAERRIEKIRGDRED